MITKVTGNGHNQQGPHYQALSLGFPGIEGGIASWKLSSPFLGLSGLEFLTLPKMAPWRQQDSLGSDARPTSPSPLSPTPELSQKSAPQVHYQSSLFFSEGPSFFICEKGEGESKTGWEEINSPVRKGFPCESSHQVHPKLLSLGVYKPSQQIYLSHPLSQCTQTYPLQHPTVPRSQSCCNRSALGWGVWSGLQFSTQMKGAAKNNLV